MKMEQTQVKEFMLLAGQECPDNPTMPSLEEAVCKSCGQPSGGATHCRVCSLLSKIANLEAAGDAMAMRLETQNGCIAPKLAANWQSAKQ